MGKVEDGEAREQLDGQESTDEGQESCEYTFLLSENSPLQHLPEAVARMAVIKIFLAGFHAWQRAGYEENYKNVPEFCYSAPKSEVKEKGYTLVPSRYIEFINRDENIDFDTKMKTLQAELKELLVAEEKSKKDLLDVFKELGYEIEL